MRADWGQGRAGSYRRPCPHWGVFAFDFHPSSSLFLEPGTSLLVSPPPLPNERPYSAGVALRGRTRPEGPGNLISPRLRFPEFASLKRDGCLLSPPGKGGSHIKVGCGNQYMEETRGREGKWAGPILVVFQVFLPDLWQIEAVHT